MVIGFLVIDVRVPKLPIDSMGLPQTQEKMAIGYPWDHDTFSWILG